LKPNIGFHAIDASKVAAVGDADAQVQNGSAVRINHAPSRPDGIRCGWQWLLLGPFQPSTSGFDLRQCNRA
jgi:hypothetical protein